MTIPLWRHRNIWDRHLRENFTSHNVIPNFRLNEDIVSTADFIFCRIGIRKLSRTGVRTKFMSTWYVARYCLKISMEILRKPDNLTFIQGDQFPGWCLKLRPSRYDVGPLTTTSRLRHKCVYCHIYNLRSGPHIAFGSYIWLSDWNIGSYSLLSSPSSVYATGCGDGLKWPWHIPCGITIPAHLITFCLVGRALCSDLNVEIKPAFWCMYEEKEGCLVASFIISPLPLPAFFFCLLFQRVDLCRSLGSTLFNMQWISYMPPTLMLKNSAEGMFFISFCWHLAMVCENWILPVTGLPMPSFSLKWKSKHNVSERG